MNAKLRQLFDDALDLPETDRVQLAELLLESVGPATEQQLRSEWEAELARRAQELETGAVKPLPWAEVRRKLWEGIGMKRDPEYWTHR